MGESYSPVEVVPDHRLAELDGVRIGETISSEVELPIEEAFFENHLPFIYGGSLERSVNPSLDAIVSKAERLHLFTVENARIAGYDSVCLVGGRQAIRSTTAFLLSHMERSHFRYIDGVLSVRDQTIVQKLEGRFFLGFSAPYKNYAHWTTDTLPLWVYFSENYRDSDIRLLLPKNILSFQKQALEVLGIDDRHVYFIEDEIVECEHIMICSQVSLWSVPTIVASAAEKVARLVTKSEPKRKGRVFLSRGDVTKRLLLNEDEARDLLSHHGMQFIKASDLSYSEQVELMVQSEVVMAIHGAALANSIYCKPGTHMVEIFPEYCVQPHYRAFAARKNMKYSAIYGTCFEFEDSRQILNAWDHNFVIDMNALEHCILKIEADLIRSALVS